MVRPTLLSMVVLTACFGSLSPDRSPTGLPPDDTAPPPAAPAPPPPPTVVIATVKVTQPGTIRVGAQVQITPVARDAAGQVVSLATEQVTYFSLNTRVATITGSGLVTAIAPGVAHIGVHVRLTNTTVSVRVVD